MNILPTCNITNGTKLFGYIRTQSNAVEHQSLDWVELS